MMFLKLISQLLQQEIHASTNDIALTKIDRSAYAALPNKLQQVNPHNIMLIDKQYQQ